MSTTNTATAAAATDVNGWQVTLVGAGVIGAGWAGRCLAAGCDVVVSDPSQDAYERLVATVKQAWPILEKRGLAAGASLQRLSYEADVAKAVADADFIQESAPEREDLKSKILADVDAAAPMDTIIASSTSGILPTNLQADCVHAERVIVAHPFNPVYLLPLVELVGGEQTDAANIKRAQAFYKGLGMRPMVVRREIEGFIADRLLEALWREGLHLVNDGVATTEEVDAAVTYGAGLRWAQMGTFFTYHLAGGEAGMRHMLEQFGPALKLPWTKLEAPELTDELIDRVVEGCEHQAAGRSIDELMARRDEFLSRLLDLVSEYWPENEGLEGRI